MSKKRDRNKKKNVRPGPALPAPAEPHSRDKKRDRQTAQHNARLHRIKRWRTVALLIGLVPLVGSQSCDWGLTIACVPREIYLGIWAAIFGAVVGLSIRLVLERRRFEQRSPPG